MQIVKTFSYTNDPTWTQIFFRNVPPNPDAKAMQSVLEKCLQFQIPIFGVHCNRLTYASKGYRFLFIKETQVHQVTSLKVKLKDYKLEFIKAQRKLIKQPNANTSIGRGTGRGSGAPHLEPISKTLLVHTSLNRNTNIWGRDLYSRPSYRDADFTNIRGYNLSKRIHNSNIIRANLANNNNNNNTFSGSGERSARVFTCTSKLIVDI